MRFLQSNSVQYVPFYIMCEDSNMRFLFNMHLFILRVKTTIWEYVPFYIMCEDSSMRFLFNMHLFILRVKTTIWDFCLICTFLYYAWRRQYEISPESNYVQTLQKSFGWGPPSVYTHAKYITYARKRSCSPCWISEDYGNIKITQHALKVSEPSECWSWTLYGRRRNARLTYSAQHGSALVSMSWSAS